MLNLLGRSAVRYEPLKQQKTSNCLSAKKVLYAIFFSGKSVAIQVPLKKGKSITGKYYKDVVIMPQPIRLPLLQMFCKKRR